MKKIYTVVIACMFAHFGMAQAPYFNWARQMGKVGNSDHIVIATDQDGNLLAAGTFLDDADYDHSAGEQLFDAGDTQDIFITKTDPNGGFVWAKQIKSLNPSYNNALVHGLVADAQGNIYITGSYEDTVDFDPNPSVEHKVAAVFDTNDDQDVFVAKYSPDGEFIWVKTVGNIHEDVGRSIMEAGNGNLIVVGGFQLGVDFDPGMGEAILPNGVDDAIFILTLTPDGEFVDAKKISGTQSVFSSSVTIDASDNLYIIGGTTNATTVDFDPGPATYNLTSTGSGLRYICKLDNSLACVWAKKIICTGSFNAPQSVAVGSNGDVVVSGYFTETLDADPSDSSSYDLVSLGFQDAYVLKLDAGGDFVWGERFGNETTEEAPALAVDADNNVLIGLKILSSQIDADPGPAVQTVTNGGNMDIVLVQLNSNGDFNWFRQISGASYQLVDDLITTNSGIYSAGSFQGATDFDPGSGVSTFYPDESMDFFIHKMSGTPTGLPVLNTDAHFNLFPNPTNGLVTVAMNKTLRIATVDLYNAIGALVETIYVDKSSFDIDLSHQPVGMYMIKATNADGSTASQKVIRQ